MSKPNTYYPEYSSQSRGNEEQEALIDRRRNSGANMVDSSKSNGNNNMNGFSRLNKRQFKFLGVILIYASVIYVSKFMSSKLKKAAEEAGSHNLSNNVRIIDEDEPHAVALISHPPAPTSEKDDSVIFHNLKDTVELFDPENDTPLFWAVPKSGTSSIKSILTKCLDLRIASSTHMIDYDKEIEKEKKLRVIDLGDDKGQFINVNFGYLPGIEQAKKWKMADSNIVDVAATSYFTDAAAIFTHKRPASVFTVFRHPVERMVSDYHYQQVADWEATYDKKKTQITLMEYATNPKYHVDNWMTRMLADVHQGPVTDKDFQFAKTVLHEKVLVLFLDQIDESVERLLTYYDWYPSLHKRASLEDDPQVDEDRENDQASSSTIRGGRAIGGHQCLNIFKHSSHQNKNKHPTPQPDSEEWSALKNINEYDINLYWYARELFDGEQKELFAELRDYRRD